MSRISADERFEQKFIPEPNSGCWLWNASSNTDGYGLFFFNGKIKSAHQFSFSKRYGYIPSNGKEIDHICRNRMCVNPEHLREVTHKENMENAIFFLSLKTHCPSGHPYSGKNVRFNKNGSRACRTCERNKMRLRRDSKFVGPWNRGKTHCIRGHEFNEENTAVAKDGRRGCKICKSSWKRTQESSARSMIERR